MTTLDPAAVDALAIILTEAQNLLDDPTDDAPNRIATIVQAARDLDRVAGHRLACALITRHNGELVDRYRTAQG